MDIILIALQLPLALMALYLDVLSIAAVIGSGKPKPIPPRSRFALLVPAHNEEKQLPRLLRSVSALDYPHDLYDVHVVADNCTDDTAAVGRAGGALVHERQDELLRGKGYALQWLLARIRESGRPYDGYIVVDADSVVSKNLLTVMNRHLARGDQVIQCQDGVLNRGESWVSALSYIALALFNHLRPRGRDALGLSVGLHGNGMCFTSSIIDRFGWEEFGLAEDVAFHVKLVSEGLRVRYAGDASVLAEQPTSLGQAYSQSVRWERGRLQMLRDFGPQLLAQGIRRRDARPLDALAEQVIPPLSLLTGVTALNFLLNAWLRRRVPFILASTVVLAEIAYVVTGLRLARAPRSIYRSLLKAPFYIVWKLWTFAVAAAHTRDSQWVRTARAEEES